MSSQAKPPRVLIVCENASMRIGGEAPLPLHYFRIMRQRGIESWLITNQRTQHELSELVPELQPYIVYTPDTPADRFLHGLSRKMSPRISYFTLQMLSRWRNQRHQVRQARRLVREHGIDVVHQPIPISQRETSMLHDVGAPVIFGPMNGNMTFPPAFAGLQSKGTALFTKIGRHASGLMNRIFSGKRRAAVLLVANERTRKGLPGGVCSNVIQFVENGVVLPVWKLKDYSQPSSGPCRFAFVGRLVDWKGVELLIEAFARTGGKTPAKLEIIGDGNERERLAAQARQLNVAEHVTFHGWQTQPAAAELLKACDVFVLPSIHECGGAVVLEAMAVGLPVIATAWGGPADYIDPSCGILVPPDTRESLIDGLSNAMLRLAGDPARRREMGLAGRAKVEREYDWERKVDQMLNVYASVRR